MQAEPAAAGNELLIGYCGLCCSNCGMLRKGRCAGCHSDRPMNRNCAMKQCAKGRNYSTCAECTDFDDLGRCRKLNNLVSKCFGLLFRTDRIGNLHRIREIGLERFREEKRLDGKP